MIGFEQIIWFVNVLTWGYYVYKVMFTGCLQDVYKVKLLVFSFLNRFCKRVNIVNMVFTFQKKRGLEWCFLPFHVGHLHRRLDDGQMG